MCVCVLRARAGARSCFACWPGQSTDERSPPVCATRCLPYARGGDSFDFFLNTAAAAAAVAAAAAAAASALLQTRQAARAYAYSYNCVVRLQAFGRGVGGRAKYIRRCRALVVWQRWCRAQVCP